MKIAITIGVVLLLVMLALNIKQCNDSDAVKRDVIEMKQLADGIARSQSEFATKKDVEKMAENSLDYVAVKKDMDKMGASLKGLGELLAQSLGRQGTNMGSSGTRPRPPSDPNDPNSHVCPDGSACPDPYGYMSNSQIFAMTEPFSNGAEVPIGSVAFDAWKEKPWSVDQRPRDYHVTTVVGEDEEGRQYHYNKFEIGVDGKMHTVPISDAKFVQVYPEPSFHWWNPRVGIGISSGVGVNPVGPSVTPTVSASVLSYGQNKKRLSWVFGRVGVGYDVVEKSPQVSIAPAMWNVGTAVDFVQNTYLGPVVGISLNGTVAVSGGITTDF